MTWAMTRAMTRVDGRIDWPRLLWLSLITGAGFFLLGYGGIRITGHGRMIALIWPANAFVVCMIVRLSRSRLQDIAMMAAALAAEIGINIVVGAPALIDLGFTAVSLIEIVASLIAVRLLGSRRFRDLRGGLRFLGGAIIAPALGGALLAAGIMVLAGNHNWLADSRHWFAANVLGFCIVLPIGLDFSWRKLVKLRLPQRKLEAALVVLGVTLLSLYAIRWSSHPMPFIILPAALAATVRFRLLGAGMAMLLVLAIALASSSEIGTPGEFVARIEMIQVFLAVASVICVRAAMLLNERDVHLALIEGKRRSAVRASRFKSQLLSHVGQEARGPLSAIIGIATVLESGKLAPDRAQEFAHVVAYNGELLQRLYADLLDLASAETGALTIQMEKVRVGQTLKSCIGAIRLDAALGGKPVLMEKVEDDLSVHADPQRLAQIINSLIANSYKYGDNDSPIRVRTWRLGDGFGRIEILNTGPGIPLREREAMYRPFGPGSGGRTVPGAGLGLSIAKLLAEKQGGRIDFESIPGRQTRFWIDLPLAA
jgi:signal transduction histidine kinase